MFTFLVECFAVAAEGVRSVGTYRRIPAHFAECIQIQDLMKSCVPAWTDKWSGVFVDHKTACPRESRRKWIHAIRRRHACFVSYIHGLDDLNTGTDWLTCCILEIVAKI